ncbi:MAG: UvrB/UvrC motif-containing protein, partial [Muribaculaceae bacterium]|nr:UvrB/UvrC motif-containing protein [Muribaculaceae bacterium]
EDDDDVAAKGGRRQQRHDGKRKGAEHLYTQEFATSVDIAADPVIPYMNRDELERSITRLRGEMLEAAKKMEFIEAARLRDEVIKMEQRLEQWK